MALDNEDRAHLEKTIDSTIRQVPGLVKMARLEEYKKYMQYKDADDLVLGFAIGMIYGGFVEHFVTRHQSEPKLDEIGEANQVILRRTREVKEAIFQCG